MNEKRKNTRSSSSALPLDFTRMVCEVLTTTFEPGLRALEMYWEKPYFAVTGKIFLDELVMSVSLLGRGQLHATTIHASTDFDPKASSPTAEVLLGACVDAIGGLLSQLLDPKHPGIIEQVAHASLAHFEEIPFVWTLVKVNKRELYLKVDKSNPELEEMTEAWLRENDPEQKARQAREEKESEDLFVVGPKSKGDSGEGGSSGMLH